MEEKGDITFSGLARHVCSYPLREGNSFVPLIDGIPAFTTIISAAKAASHSLHVVVAFIELGKIQIELNLFPFSRKKGTK